MADKKFGVRQIDLIGASGSTNIETPNTLNLKSNQVAISTDLSIGGSVVSHVLVGSGFSVGIGTSVPKSALEVDGTARATNFIGNGSGLTNITGTGSGIGVSVAGATVGTAQTINFIGAAVTTSEAQSGIVTCTITSGGTLDRNLTVGSFRVTSAGATLSPGGVVAGVATVNNSNVTNLNVTGVATVNNSNVTNLNVTGIVTASSFDGNITGIATYTSEWIITSNGSSDYRFTGPGFDGTENDPTIYLARGQEYKFTNNMGAHPFQIRTAIDGSAYNDGISNNGVSNGTLTWDVQMDAPNVLYYQCTSHAGMVGKIYIGNSGDSVNVGTAVTLNSGGVVAGLGTINYVDATNVNVSGVSTFVGVSTFSANANVGVDTSVGIIMTASNGTRYRLFVEDDGSLSTIALS